MFNMRSTDVFLGLVFNIASYALLAHIIAHQCDLQPKELIFQGGDCHLYRNHLDVAREQIGRTGYPPPKLTINPGRDVPSVDDYQIDDFELTSYNHEGPLMAEMAV
jgi:thymidylate synthase